VAVSPGLGEVVQVNDLYGPNPAQTRNKARLQNEALGLGNSAFLEKISELIIRQLEKEKEDW